MAWLSSNWGYRKSITLSRASGAVSNYQMKILVGESSGAAGEDVDCGGNCKSDFSDLRFTAADGTTLLDYWIESVSGTTPNQLAAIWVEFDSIGTGDTTFYMYYGYASATAVSNGDNTFILFDDFEDGSINGSKWTNPGSWSEGSGVLSKLANNTNTNHALLSVNTYASSIAIHARAKVGSDWSNEYGWGNAVIFDQTWATSGFLAGHFLDATFDYYRMSKYPGPVTATTTESIVADTWYNYELRVIASDQKFFVNGTQKAALTQAIPTDPTKVGLVCTRTSASSAYTSYFDWVFVRKCLATEPAFGSWGAEETAQLEVAFEATQGLVVQAYAPSMQLLALYTAFGTPPGLVISAHNLSVAITDTIAAVGSLRFLAIKPRAAISGVSPGTLWTVIKPTAIFGSEV